MKSKPVISPIPFTGLDAVELRTAAFIVPRPAACLAPPDRFAGGVRFLPRLFMLVLLAGLAAGPALARVGEPVAEIRKRYGRPQGTPDKHTTFWMFENDFGAMHYTVTTNDKGLSIAEGLKPYRLTRFTAKDAETFIAMQFAGRPEADRRTIAPGQAYRFAGQAFTCGPNEHVVVDETAGVLLVWNKGDQPSVLAVGPEMLQRTK